MAGFSGRKSSNKKTVLDITSHYLLVKVEDNICGVCDSSVRMPSDEQRIVLCPKCDYCVTLMMYIMKKCMEMSFASRFHYHLTKLNLRTNHGSARSSSPGYRFSHGRARRYTPTNEGALSDISDGISNLDLD